jgi:AraC-like DNA-binding protein
MAELRFEGNAMQPLLIRGSDEAAFGEIEMSLRRCADAEHFAHLTDGSWALMLSASSGEALARAVQRCADALLRFGALVIIGDIARDAHSLVLSCRMLCKAADYFEADRQESAVLSVGKMRWPGGIAPLSYAPLELAQSALRDAPGVFEARLHAWTARAVASANATIDDVRLVLIGALSRIAATNPECFNEACRACILAIYNTASIWRAEASMRGFVLAMAEMNRTHPNEMDSGMDQAMRYIATHFTDNLRLESVASRFHFSAMQFGRLFQKANGIGYTEYIHRLRMAWAKTLLEHTDLRVADVAKECGYADAKYFAQLFQKAYHITPSAARAQK